MPNTALSLAMCMSQAAITSSPAPRQKPLTRAITGTGRSAATLHMRWISLRKSRAFGGIEFAEFMQVGAAHEGAVALSGNDQHPQVGIVRQRGDGVDEGGDLGLAQAVQPRRRC